MKSIVHILKLVEEVYLHNKKDDSSQHDWRNWNQGWQYKGDVDDKEYLKDRSKLFDLNGNGWWHYDGVAMRPKFLSSLQLSHQKDSFKRWAKQMKDLTR
jgi:hypothetical protein